MRMEFTWLKKKSVLNKYVWIWRMIKQGKNLRDILQVKLGDSLNTAVALKIGEKKSSEIS